MKIKLRFITTVLLTAMLLAGMTSRAQEKDEKEEKKGFQKEKLFSGGSIALGFSNNSFLIGGSPVFGYSVAHWADLGLVVNYNYTSYRDVNTINDKLKQTVYGGGAFTRIFPLKFLFAQAQFEHNWINMRYIAGPGGYSSRIPRTEGNSLLVGGGYATGRDPDYRGIYGYFAILFDVAKERNSPYVDYLGRTQPILKAGVHIPLFQGRGSF